MEQTSTLAPRRAMRVDDWFHSMINLLIGALLGSAATGLAQLLLARMLHEHGAEANSSALPAP